MHGVTEIPDSLRPVQEQLTGAIERVEAVFDRELRSDLPPVADLVGHVERYRGKMLRPTLAVLSGLAASGDSDPSSPVSDDHVTVGAVCEMVHMATLVHDDVLDEAETRRRGDTVNRLRGNEAAVILGDYLIAAAYHLCSSLDSQHAARTIGRVSMVMCAGELLQLHHREDFSLDEATYNEIIERKTAALIAAACELGASLSTSDDRVVRALGRYGLRLGVAFQIQDDLLDLTGEETVVGKSVGKDLEKGKLTLPMIHHLEAAPPAQRGRSLELIAAASHARGSDGRGPELLRALRETGSIEHACRHAASLVAEARDALTVVPDGPATDYLRTLADAVVRRSF